MLGEEVGDPVGDERPVREDRDQQPLRARVEVELGEVGPQQHLAAGEQHEQRALGDDLVDELLQPLEAELALALLARARRLVHVAVDAVQVAAVGRLDRALDRDAAAVEPGALAELEEGDLADAARGGEATRASCRPCGSSTRKQPSVGPVRLVRVLQPVTAISPETMRTRTTFGRSYASRVGRFFMLDPPVWRV